MGTGGRLATAVAVGALAGVAPALALLASSGVDTDPPVWWAMGGHEVSCNPAPRHASVL